MYVLLFFCVTFLTLLGQPTPGEAQVRLENPAPGSSQSGIGLISGWICQARRVDIEIDGRATFQAAYGTARSDTQPDCGDTDNGFGLLFNWNLLGDGTNHRVRVLADGVEVASSTFTVTTLGLGEFPRGLSGSGTIADFPQTERSTNVQWQESLQNFTISAKGPKLDISERSLAFGKVRLSENQVAQLTVTNIAGGTLTGKVSAPEPFFILTNQTFNLTAGQKATISFTFGPTSLGNFEAVATITSNGGNATVALSGVGIPKLLPPPPESVLIHSHKK